MTVIKSNTKVLTSAGRVLVTNGGLEFIGTAKTFPFNISSNPASLGGIVLVLRFNTPTVVTVDYGNGEIKIFPPLTEFSFLGNTLAVPSPHEIYYYPDDTIKDRRVRISYNRSNLIQLGSNAFLVTKQPLNFNFASHPALSSFSISQAIITTIDVASITTTSNPSLVSMDLRFFADTSPFYTQIPINLLSLQLTVLSYGTSVFKTKPISETNADKISMLKDTLTNLLVYVNYDDTTGLPNTWNQLYKLTTLSLSNCIFTTIPVTLSQITSLRVLQMQRAPITSWAGIETLIDLRTINISKEAVLLPLSTYFNGMTLLKTVAAIGTVVSSGHAITFTQEWYNKVTSVSSMSTGNTQFRQMVFSIQQNTSSDLDTVIPDGIFQQPVGYVQGSSNGSPASSLERIWVLVNQYAHTWNYRSI